MQRLLHLHSVETIGNENICASKLLLGGLQGQVVAAPAFALVHGKVKPGASTGSIDVIIRSSDKDLSNQVAASVHAALR